MKRWSNCRRGYGSNYEDSGKSGDRWDRTEERVVAAASPLTPPSQFPKEEDRGKCEEISAVIESVAGKNRYGVGGGSVEPREI